LPVGGGKEKASKLAERMTEVDLDDIPTYKTSNQKKNIAKADKHYKDNAVEIKSL